MSKSHVSSETTQSKRSPGRPKKVSELSDTDTRAAILQRAKRLFMKSGFGAVSISTIVEAVGITKPTLYYYFEDKESLYAAVLTDMLQKGGQYITAGIAEKQTLRDRLSNLANGYFKNAPTSISLLMRDARENLTPEKAQTVYQAHHDYIIQPFVTMLNEAVAAGEMPPQDTLVLAHFVVGMLEALVISFTLHYSRQFQFDEKADMVIGLLFNGLLHGADV